VVVGGGGDGRWGVGGQGGALGGGGGGGLFIEAPNTGNGVTDRKVFRKEKKGCKHRPSEIWWGFTHHEIPSPRKLRHLKERHMLAMTPAENREEGASKDCAGRIKQGKMSVPRGTQGIWGAKFRGTL